MRRLRLATAALSLAALAACANDTAVPTEQNASLVAEANLAVSLGASADSAATRQVGTLDGLLQAFFGRLRQTDDPRARALLAESRALADSGRAARQAGDLATARRYFEAAHYVLFQAVVLVLPDAPTRIGATVDTVRTRMLTRLDTLPAPRIRQVLAFVGDLRTRADSAFAAGQPARALGLNVRAMEMLVALRQHLQRPGGAGLPGDQGSYPPPGTPPDIRLP